ncbi:MAG: N-acetylneuraminate synthase family protein [Taibaiella sp.]|jgi:sialic acid synthase SpsE
MNKSYLYGETAFHHQGDYDYLIKLIDEIANCGIQGIKFQVLTDINDFVTTRHTSFQELAAYCFSFEQWESIFKYTREKGLDIILMPLNIEACGLIDLYEIRYLDIHSVSFNDKKLLNKINSYAVDIILGVGGRTLDEIYSLIDFFQGKVKILMTGFQSFPSKLQNIKLGRISVLKSLFQNLQIGYADHSSFEDEYSIISNEYARILGATVFEKHITLEEDNKRVDSASAVNTEKIETTKRRLDFIDKYIMDSSSLFLIGEEETTYRNRQLVCVAAQDLEEGHTITEEDILLKMYSDNTEAVFKVEHLVGKKLLNKMCFNEIFKQDNIR